MNKQKEYIDDYLLGRWVSGEANAEEQKKVEEWGALSDENQKVLNDSSHIMDSIGQLKIMQTVNSSSAIQRVKHRIEKTESPSQKLLFYWQKIAAVIVIPLLIYGLYEAIANYRSNSIEKLTWNEISTPVGLRSVFHLPDGTKVWLNGNTTLKYPMQFSKNERLVKLKGEAYFDVVSDKQHPFVVNSGGLFVQAVGTAFNVSAYPGDSRLETALVRGKVNLMRETKQGRQPITSLKPGNVAVYNRLTHENQVFTANMDK